MDILNTLNQAASYLGATAGSDEVFIMDGQNFQQIFQNARPLKISVIEPSKIMKHPLEDGSTITDHMVIEPVRIEISMIYNKGFKDTIEQVKTCFDQGKLLTIVAKAKAYENMVLADMPHDEDPDYMDVLMSTLRFEEARFVTPEYGELPASEVQKTKDASTVNRGTQQTTPTSEIEMAEAEDSYNDSGAVGSTGSKYTGLGERRIKK